MMDVHAETFHLSDHAFRALRNLRDKPTKRVGYQASLERLVHKGFVMETSLAPGYRLTTLGQLILGLGDAGRKQLANSSAANLELLLDIVTHRGLLTAAEVDHRVLRAIGPDSSRRWARQRLGEGVMVVEATAQGLAIARVVSEPFAWSEDLADLERYRIVTSLAPYTSLFPALARGALLDPEDLPELYQLRDLGFAQLVDPELAPPPRITARRFRGAPLWCLTPAGWCEARRLLFTAELPPTPPPSTPDPVQPLPLGSGQTLRALVQGEALLRHDEHRLRDLEALHLAERLVPEEPHEPCRWRATMAGVTLATVELHARASAEAMEHGIAEPGHTQVDPRTARAALGPSPTL